MVYKIFYLIQKRKLYFLFGSSYMWDLNRKNLLAFLLSTSTKLADINKEENILKTTIQSISLYMILYFNILKTKPRND